MVKNIVKGELIFKKAEECNLLDSYLIADMKDTLLFNKAICVGMAANMIGVNKRAIVLFDNEELLFMFNPIIIKKESEYEAEEGCLSLTGTRKCIRHKKIKVEYLDESFRKIIKTYTNFTAEIIEHECDHLEGIII